MKTFVCKHCGSDDIRRDAWVRWNPHHAAWEAAEIFDHAHCHHCDGQTTLVEKDAPAPTPPLPSPHSKGEAIAMIFDIAGPYEGQVFEDLPREIRRLIVEVWSKCTGHFDSSEVERPLVHHGCVDLSGYRRHGVMPPHRPATTLRLLP